MRTVCPALSFAISIKACHAVNAASGTAAASVKVVVFGLSAASFSARTAYSAQPPPKSA
jgi:predicted component of type VI protein secretion system